MYPISNLVRDYLLQNKLTRVEFVKKLRYKNLEKGLYNLNQLLQEGIVNRYLVTRLPNAMKIDPSIIKKAVLRTFRMKKNRNGYGFHPFLFIKTESENTGNNPVIKLFGYERLKTLKLPAYILDLPIQEQLDLIKNEICKNYRDLHGTIAVFGNITGYVYCSRENEPEYEKLHFSIHGNIAESTLNLYSLQHLNNTKNRVAVV